MDHAGEGPNHSFAPPPAGGAERAYLAALLQGFLFGANKIERPESVDWDRLASCLRGHHMVVPLLLPRLDLRSAPDELVRRLEASAQRYRLQSGLLMHELFRILPALEAGGYAPVVLKGPALAHTVYGGRPRYFTDLDLLVAPADLAGAGEALERLGYRYDSTASAPPGTYLRHHFHFCYRNSAQMMVELHWDLSLPDDYVRLDAVNWRRRSRQVRVADAEMRIPHDDDQLLHAAKQCLDTSFADLRRIVDGAVLLRAGAADIPGLAARARASGLATSLWLLLRMARRMTGVGDVALESELAPGRIVRACLTSLEFEAKALDLYVYRRHGLGKLIRWLCAPNRAAAGRELRRHFVPRGWGLVALGIDPDTPPGPRLRLRIFSARVLSFAKLFAYQLWCLARSSVQKSASSAS